MCVCVCACACACMTQVHRVIKVHEKYDGSTDVLTKGDNNDVDDRGLYAPDQRWLNKKHIIGRAVGYHICSYM